MSACRGCCAPIEFATSPKGRALPLSFVADLGAQEERYSLAIPEKLPDAHRYEVVHGDAIQHPEGRWVSHFVVCPDRAKFSKKGGKTS